jgi:hypothetical protein
MKIYGNIVEISIPANSGDTVHIKLPNGYSVEQLKITGLINCFGIHRGIEVSIGNSYRFPPVNSCSPTSFDIFIKNTTTVSYILFIIEKFGQIPDEHYFDKTFEPILVTGDDGKEYNVIPSDQFK